MTPTKPTPLGTDGLITVTEPHEGAFSILMPDGWTNRADLQREHSLNRIIASAVSPDGDTMFHLGDPRLPIFTAPLPYLDPSLMQFAPHMRIQPYTPAEYFFREYVQQSFGRAPEFRITEIDPRSEFSRSGRPQPQQTAITSVAITFEHSGTGKLLRCRLYGTTRATQSVWSADLLIVSTTGDLEHFSRIGIRMMTSRHFDPRWEAAQQRLHEHRMAMGQQQLDFTNRMTEIQRQGHDQRMRDIQSFGQANTQMHNERMAQMDANHQSWMSEQAQSDTTHQSCMEQQSRDDDMQSSRVNAIREEHTVADSSGATYQVSAHHDRYFVNKVENTYIGAGVTTEIADLRRTHGVNPDDYVEVKIVR